MIARRSFFTRLGLLVGGLVSAPNLYLPKQQPVGWTWKKLPPVQDELASVLPRLQEAQRRAAVNPLPNAAPPFATQTILGTWDSFDVLGENGLWTKHWRWTGPGKPPAAFPAYEGGPNPQEFLARHALVYDENVFCPIVPLSPEHCLSFTATAHPKKIS